MALVVGRQIGDSNFSTTVALPSGAGTSLSTAFDLVGNTLSAGTIFPEEVTLQVDVPADTALVSGATRKYTVYADSAATPTTALTGYGVYTITGTAGNGAAKTIYWRLPANVARYVSLNIDGGTSGSGDSTGISATVALKF